MLSDLSIEWKIPKRLNLGGLNLGYLTVGTYPKASFWLRGTASDHALELLRLVGIPDQIIHATGLLSELSFHRGQIRVLKDSLLMPVQLGEIRESTQGSQIVNRLFAFGSVKTEDEDEKVPTESDTTQQTATRIKRHLKVTWTFLETEKLRESTTTGREKIITDLQQIFPDCSRDELTKKRAEVLAGLKEIAATSRENLLIGKNTRKMVAIPAFVESWFKLGPQPNGSSWAPMMP
jgi:hypothetical protein